MLRISCIFGLLEGLSYFTQTISLQTISLGDAACITAFSVVVIPFLAAILKIDHLKYSAVLAALLCMLLKTPQKFKILYNTPEAMR